jgi:hypothetical protein
MKRITTSLLVVFCLAAFASVASAHPGARIDRREGRQYARIHQGVRGGQLTPREVQRLRMSERHIRRTERRSWRDGRLSVPERRRLNRELNRSSRQIHRLRHNGRMI